MFGSFKNLLMSRTKKENFKKEQIRGTIKQLMRVRGLRSISIANYAKYKHTESSWLHSMKLDLMDGYLYLYGFPENPLDKRAGQRLENLTIEQYDEAYRNVENILNEEDNIPSKIKRNILVKVSR
jgi:hypothetical protein